MSIIYNRPVTGVASAERLIIQRICTEAITSKRLVSADSGTHVSHAQSNDASKSRVLGLALESGNIGDEVSILLFGNDTDVSYSFSLNDPLYLNLNGEFSSTPPSSGWLVNVASSNGTGSIFINIDEPIEM